jgi:hypothetical protein
MLAVSPEAITVGTLWFKTTASFQVTFDEKSFTLKQIAF